MPLDASVVGKRSSWSLWIPHLHEGDRSVDPSDVPAPLKIGHISGDVNFLILTPLLDFRAESAPLVAVLTVHTAMEPSEVDIAGYSCFNTSLARTGLCHAK